MSSLAFVTHPSVRIKGTENSYTPSQCLDERCPVKAPHLHCPFCVKTDAYQDPVILKAHYRVKHVDKGIEFAGLKILRCCDQCDIIGIIKGEKRFKGAHWHCYRCRNGFNRRDEAIKHYKTHFRNPQTTFQIQITQDLNSPPEVRTHEEHGNNQDAFASIENPVQEIIHPALSQTGISLSEQTDVMTAGAITTRHGGGVKKIKVKHGLLDKDNTEENEDEETIMIIQGDQLESAFASHIINSGELTVLNKTVDPTLSWEIRFRLEEEEKNIYKSKAEEYKAQVELLQQQVSELENQLAQQSELKFHELVESLSSGELNKQVLSQQLSKFLEHYHLQAHGTVAIVEDDSTSPHLTAKQHEQMKPEEVAIHALDHDAGELKTNGLVSQQLDTNTAITHINEIPNGFQVVCTTSEGHVVVSHAPGSVVASCISGEDAGIPSECINSCSSTSSIPASVCERTGVLYTHVIGAHIKEEISSELPQEELADVSGEQSCLMEVVAAADGLASLGTDIVEASAGQESQNAFVMDMDDSQRIIITAEDSSNSCEDQPTGITQDVPSEPPVKRVKIT